MREAIVETFSNRFALMAPGIAGKVTFAITLYCVISSVTLPLINAIWLGELPLLALIQLPKVMPAGWLRVNVVMEMIKVGGFSKGSFSPDFIMARSYALALVYAAPIFSVLILRVSETRAALPNRFIVAALLALIIDFGLTMALGQQRHLTIY